METQSNWLIISALTFIAVIATTVFYVVSWAVKLFIEYFYKNPRLPGSK